MKFTEWAQYSALSPRTAPINSNNTSNACSVVPSIRSGRSSGHCAITSDGGRVRPSGTGRRCHSSSLMKGVSGCSSRNTPSSTSTSVACAATRLASLASPRRRGFTSSRYQSATSPQKKARAVAAASWKR